MKKTNLFNSNLTPLLIFLTLFLSGCGSMDNAVGPTRDLYMTAKNQPLEVMQGENIVEYSYATYRRVYEVTNTTRMWNLVGNTPLPPAVYGDCTLCYSETESRYYFLYPHGITKSTFALQGALLVGYSTKKDYSDPQPFVGNAGIMPNGRLVAYDDDARPNGKGRKVPLRDRTFSFKTLSFDSWDDDFLSVTYRVESGPKNPVGFTKTLDFDLTESKIIEVEGAIFEVLDASPEKMTVKILSGFSLANY